MQQNVARVRAILRTNLKYWMWSTIASTLGYALILRVLFNSNLTSWKNESVNYWPILAVLLFALLPILVYVGGVGWKNVHGVTGENLNTKAVKRHLFIVGGVVWISAACIPIALLMGWTLLAMIASGVGLLAWGIGLRLFFSYVQTV